MSEECRLRTRIHGFRHSKFHESSFKNATNVLTRSSSVHGRARKHRTRRRIRSARKCRLFRAGGCSQPPGRRRRARRGAEEEAVSGLHCKQSVGGQVLSRSGWTLRRHQGRRSDARPSHQRWLQSDCEKMSSCLTLLPISIAFYMPLPIRHAAEFCKRSRKKADARSIRKPDSAPAISSSE